MAPSTARPPAATGSPENVSSSSGKLESKATRKTAGTASAQATRNIFARRPSDGIRRHSNSARKWPVLTKIPRRKNARRRIVHPRLVVPRWRVTRNCGGGCSPSGTGASLGLREITTPKQPSRCYARKWRMWMAGSTGPDGTLITRNARTVDDPLVRLRTTGSVTTADNAIFGTTIKWWQPRHR